MLLMCTSACCLPMQGAFPMQTCCSAAALQEGRCNLVAAACTTLAQHMAAAPESKGMAMLAQKPRPVTEGEASGRRRPQLSASPVSAESEHGPHLQECLLTKRQNCSQAHDTQGGRPASTSSGGTAVELDALLSQLLLRGSAHPHRICACLSQTGKSPGERGVSQRWPRSQRCQRPAP